MTQFAAQNLPPKGGWRVTGQTSRTQFVPGQSIPVQGYAVDFVTGYGVNGSVFITAADYANVDAIKSILGTAVKQLDAVSDLTHTS